jgi:hypothetical protein
VSQMYSRSRTLVDSRYFLICILFKRSDLYGYNLKLVNVNIQEISLRGIAQHGCSVINRNHYNSTVLYSVPVYTH